MSNTILLEKLSSTICYELNNYTELQPTLKKIVDELYKATNIEAISVRLKDKEDFPYYTYRGFDKSFILHENSLCIKDQKGNLVFEDEQNQTPLLECMCGNILRGRTDPKFPFFTSNGSFCSNHTTELLATTSENERQSHTRNYCNSCGYESVALIPIKSKGEILGLIQFNDKRKNMFTYSLIVFFENVGSQIGNAVRNNMLFDELKTSEEKYRNQYETLKKTQNQLIESISINDEQKKTAKILKDMVDEKEILIKEIHHRVRNNLQVVIGVLELQMTAKNDEKLNQILKNCVDRIKSIALVHELLNISPDLNQIDLNQYISDLSQNLIQSLKPLNCQIELKLEIEPIFVNIEKVIPIGIILNEIITNSIKHAFPTPATPNGLIEVKISRFGEKELKMVVSDNGIGISDKINPFKSEYIGLKLIKNLTEFQLDGKLKMEYNNGLIFTIFIKL